MSDVLEDATPPLLEWVVPRPGGDGSVELQAYAGHAVVIVGPNGSGKSALSHWLSANRGGSGTPVTRVLAHRRVWRLFTIHGVGEGGSRRFPGVIGRHSW